MVYPVNPTDPTSPTDLNGATQGAEEFRALKGRINAIGVGLVGNIAQPRQTVLQGQKNSNGQASHLVASATALGIDLKATTLAVYLAFAQGFTNAGAADSIEGIFADQLNYWPNLGLTNVSYLAITRTAPGVIIPVQTLAPPHYGDIYPQAGQSLVQFGGANNSAIFLDDYGPTWTRAGGAAKITNNYSKFGTGSLGGAGASNALDGVADRIICNDFHALGNGGGPWTLACWAKPFNALPGVGISVVLMSGGVFGFNVGIFNNAGTIRWFVSLSSNGAAFDIANAVVGASLPVLGTEYFLELTFDPISGGYKLYLNGTQEITIANSTRIASVGGLCLGAYYGGGNYFQGYITNFEYLPYCRHSAGTAYAVPTVAPNIATAGYSCDWFDTTCMVMRTPTVASIAGGSNPTFADISRLYIGQATTNAVAVTGTVPYAYQGKYVSPLTTVAAPATATTFGHSLGYPADQYDIRMDLINIIGEQGFTPGEVAEYFNSTNNIFPFSKSVSRTTATIINSAASPIVVNRATGVAANITAASWNCKMYAKRRW